MKNLLKLIILGLILTPQVQAANLIFQKSIRQLKPVDLQAPTAPTSGIVLGVNGRAYFDGTYAQSCQAYLTGMGAYTYSGDTGDGVYIIQPLGQQATPVTCDMTRSGGGWTLVLSGVAAGVATPSNWKSVDAVNASTVITPNANPSQKLADAFINAIPSKGGPRYMLDVQYPNYSPSVRFVGQKIYNTLACGTGASVTSYSNVELTLNPRVGGGFFSGVCGISDYDWVYPAYNYGFFQTSAIAVGTGTKNGWTSSAGHLAMWVR